MPNHTKRDSVVVYQRVHIPLVVHYGCRRLCIGFAWPSWRGYLTIIATTTSSTAAISSTFSNMIVKQQQLWCDGEGENGIIWVAHDFLALALPDRKRPVGTTHACLRIDLLTSPLFLLSWHKRISLYIMAPRRAFNNNNSYSSNGRIVTVGGSGTGGLNER